MLGGGLLSGDSTFAWGGQPADATTPAGRARKAFLTARARFQRETNSVEAPWHFGRACFDWAEFAENDAQRESIANEGIAACRQLIAREPKLAAGHYYLGMNLGQLARTKLLGALKIVEEMEHHFKTARALDAKFDFGGPDRNLGLLYFDAPGWPTSIGDKKKAREHLERAVELAPNNPENRLNLIEAHLRWHDRKNLSRELKALEELWPGARKEFAGEPWEASWADWDKRREKIKRKIAELPKAVESPQDKD